MLRAAGGVTRVGGGRAEHVIGYRQVLASSPVVNINQNETKMKLDLV